MSFQLPAELVNSACVIAFAAHLCGHDDIAVYDASWAEWGQAENALTIA